MKTARAFEGPLMIECPYCGEVMELEHDPMDGEKEDCWECGEEFKAYGIDYTPDSDEEE